MAFNEHPESRIPRPSLALPRLEHRRSAQQQPSPQLGSSTPRGRRRGTADSPSRSLRSLKTLGLNNSAPGSPRQRLSCAACSRARSSARPAASLTTAPASPRSIEASCPRHSARAIKAAHRAKVASFGANLGNLDAARAIRRRSLVPGAVALGRAAAAEAQELVAPRLPSPRGRGLEDAAA